MGECGSLWAQETPSQVGQGPRMGCSQLRGDAVWMDENAWPQASNCRGPLCTHASLHWARPSQPLHPWRGALRGAGVSDVGGPTHSQ